MGSRRFLFAFGLGGGLTAGVLVGAVMYAATGQPSTRTAWALLLGGTALTFLGAGYATWYQWASRRARSRGRVVSALSQGDLTVSSGDFEGQEDVRRLVMSLRRALSEVQR